MGQKSVYNIITAQQINGVWGIADVAFFNYFAEKSANANANNY